MGAYYSEEWLADYQSRMKHSTRNSTTRNSPSRAEAAMVKAESTRPAKRGDLEIDIERDGEGKPTRMMIGFSEQSEHERLFDCQVRALKLPKPSYEFRFMPPRRYRFDFAWPDSKVAVEVEGGIWSGGRHVRGNGYENDCKKYSEAAILGWKVIRATGKMIKDGSAIDLLQRALSAARGN